MSDKIKVLVVEPMKPCRVEEIPDTLEAILRQEQREHAQRRTQDIER